MRKIISLMHVSLDGFAASLDGSLSWASMDDELFGDVKHFLADIDETIYGRVTYQIMESYWPQVLKDPESSGDLLEHANWVENIHKNVFTKSMDSVTWNNAHILNSDLKEDVLKIKGADGNNAMIFGSPSLTHEFMKNDLIDEYRLTIQPVILGEGIPFFKNIKTLSKLQRTFSKTYESGVIAVHYTVIR